MEQNERIEGEKWYAARSAYDGQGLVISEATGRNVAVTYDERDTALAAAAPELLEALEGMVSACDKMLRHGNGAPSFRLAMAYDAIAKAKGE
jgi:hypothetical protein